MIATPWGMVYAFSFWVLYICLVQDDDRFNDDRFNMCNALYLYAEKQLTNGWLQIVASFLHLGLQILE